MIILWLCTLIYKRDVYEINNFQVSSTTGSHMIYYNATVSHTNTEQSADHIVEIKVWRFTAHQRISSLSLVCFPLYCERRRKKSGVYVQMTRSAAGEGNKTRGFSPGVSDSSSSLNENAFALKNHANHERPERAASCLPTINFSRDWILIRGRRQLICIFGHGQSIFAERKESATDLYGADSILWRKWVVARGRIFFCAFYADLKQLESDKF